MAVSSDSDTCAPLFFGGYDCDFVEPPPDSLQCAVCLLPFRDPTIPSCCGHKGCASCLGRIKAAGQPCPMCQQPFTTFLDKFFQRKVLDLRVFCSKKEEGCRWEGELRDLEKHSQKDCDHVEKECRYGCGVRYQRRLLRHHEMDECPKRPPEVITQSQLIRKMAEGIDTLEAYLSDVRGKLGTLEKARAEDQAKLAAVERAHREDQETLKQQIKDLRKESTLFLGPDWLMNTKGTVSSPYPPCHIIMPHFSRHKSNDDVWLSQPFYSAPGGYKLCLRVRANGMGIGKGTHVSAYVHLMKGENDHQLQWPFEHDVTHGILNWKSDEKHVIKTMNFKTAPADYKERVTSKEKGLGWGYLHFLPHSSLSDGPAKDTQYLHNDCLCLQVLKSKPPK